MKKMNKKIKASVGLGLLCGIVAGTLIVSNGFSSFLVDEKTLYGEQREWKLVPLGDASIDGATKVMYVMAYPHQASPAVAYASNLSNATAYEFYDGLNSEMTGETPYDTTFDLVVKMCINDSHAYNTSDSSWELGWVNATATCADLSIGADTAMTEVSIGNGTYMFVHYYLNNGGAGYQISHGETYNVTNYEFWAYH